MFTMSQPPKMLASATAAFTRIPPWSPREFRFYPHSERYLFFGFFAFLLFSWTTFFRDSTPLPSFHRLPANPVLNSTLGFQKIYVLSLPGREDRTKPLLDAANATNLTVSMLSAVRDDQIAQMDQPKGWDEKGHALGVLGCLTSHVRTWHLMISQNISSAMVLESDADWDMRVHGIMSNLATGVRNLVDWPFNEEHNVNDARLEPYGDSWDVIWFGHCGCHHYGNVRAYSWNDSAIPPQDKEWKISVSLNSDQHPMGTRSVFQLQGAVCSTGYAISLRGARKLAEYFKEGDQPIDLKLSDLCYDKSDLMCLGVYPQIISNIESTSNIDHPDVTNVDDWRKQMEAAGKSKSEIIAGKGLQYSARVNAPMVMDHNAGQDEWIAEWNTTWALQNGTMAVVPFNSTDGEEATPSDG